MSSPAAKKSRFSPSTVQLPSQPLPAAALTSTDQVHSVVVRYLQKRRYMTERLQNATTQNKAQFAMKELLRSEASSVASLALAAPPNVEPLVIEQQYAKFKVWISESPDFYKPELAQLLYPIFTHLYLDLVLAGHKLIAQKFHKRHQSTFLGNPNFASFIRVLSNILTPEDIQRDASVTTFLSTKYSVTLSNRTFHYLMRHLQQQQTMGQPHLLLYVLHAKVDVRLQDALGAPSSKHEAVQRILCDSVTTTPEVKKEEPPECNGFVKSGTDSMSKVLEVIQKVRNGPCPLPSTSIYRLSNSYSHIICGCISSNLLITGCEDSSLILWDLTPNAAMSSKIKSSNSDPSVIQLGCDSSEEELQQRKSILRGHSGPVYDLAYSKAKEGFLMSVSEDTTMRLWDLKNGVNKAVYQGHSYPIWSVDSDRVGASVVTGSMDRTAKLWHIEYTHPLRVYAGHEQDVDVVKFHPNCNYLATGGADKTIRLWSHTDAKMVRVFNGHKGSILALAFSPDGKFLASAGEDRRLKVWDLSSSSLYKDLKGHSETVQSLVWSKDSNLLASGGQDGLVRLWDVQNCSDQDQKSDLLNSFSTKCTNVIDLCYSPHNTLLATGLASPAAATS